MKWIILYLFFFTACNFAPKYSRPDPEMPISWRFESDESSTLANIKWWESLGDPILNSLIQTALENNKDLQTAIWRVCEFYAQYQVVRSSLFPQLDLEASALKERISPKANFLPPGTNPITPEYSLNFDLSYEIDFWGQIRNATYAAYDQYLAQV